MSVTTLLETLLSVGTEIDNLWSMYIVVHLAVLWFLFLVHRPLLRIERLIAIAGYGGFVLINGRALVDAYTLYEAVRNDLVTRFASELATVPETLRYLSEASRFEGRQDLIMISHLSAFCVVILLVIFRNPMIRRYYKLYPEQLHQQTS